MYFRNYRLRKTWFDICLKTPVSEDPLRNNMINNRQHCSNLNDTTSIIFIDHYEGK